MDTAVAASAHALACRNCGQPLRRLVLRGHYGRAVEIDDCASCHLLWFDDLESSRLAGTGMIDLVRAMAAGHAVPHRPLRRDLGCARCAGPVRPVANVSRFGRAQQLECRQGHGAWHTYGEWLAERGFVRPVMPSDLDAFARAGRTRHCFNCGGPAGRGDGGTCAWCGATAVLMDVDRLVRAVDPEGATWPPSRESRPRASSRAAPTASGIEAACHACGDGGGSPGQLSCARCGATRMAGDLAAAVRALEGIESALRSHEERPAEHVRARRLAALDADLPRRWEAVRALEREAAGGGLPAGDDGRGARWPGRGHRVWGGVVWLVDLLRLLRSFWGGRS